MPQTTKKSASKPQKKAGVHKHILYALDISDKSPRTKDAAVLNQIVTHFGSKLSVIAVLPDYGAGVVAQYFSRGAEEKMIEAGEKAVQAFVKKHFDKPEKVEILVCQGGIYENIIKAAKAVKADVIAVAAHRPELKNYLLGPNAAKVVRHSKISVLVLREE